MSAIGRDEADRRAAMVQEARAAVLAAVGLRTQAEVAAMLHGPDPSDIPGLLRLPLGSTVQYPTFQFDTDGTVRPIVLEVNRLLDPDGEDDWAVASWWISSDARLHGAPPLSLLGTEEQARLLDMAHAESDDW